MPSAMARPAQPPLNQTASPMTIIQDRLTGQALQIDELANKLNAHADALLGSVSTEHQEKIEMDLPPAALDRVFLRLDDLDRSLGRLAEAAGRNCTLA